MVFTFLDKSYNTDDFLVIGKLIQSERSITFIITTKYKSEIEITISQNDIFPNKDWGTGDVKTKMPEVLRQAKRARETIIELWNKGVPSYKIELQVMTR